MRPFSYLLGVLYAHTVKRQRAVYLDSWTWADFLTFEHFSEMRRAKEHFNKAVGFSLNKMEIVTSAVRLSSLVTFARLRWASNISEVRGERRDESEEDSLECKASATLDDCGTIEDASYSKVSVKCLLGFFNGIAEFMFKVTSYFSVLQKLEFQ